MKIGDRVYIIGYIDEIRKDVVIIRNDSGYFGTEKHNVFVAETVKEREAKSGLIRCKDCEFYESSIVLDKQGYCWYQNTRGFIRNDDDYCSKAERKEE